MSGHRRLLAPLAAVATAVTVAALTVPSAAAAPPPADGYTVGVGPAHDYTYYDDTPAPSFIDKDGSFHFQSSASLYGPTDPRYWAFYTGSNVDTATPDTALDGAANPADPADRNDETTVRCNNSPTGQEATYAPDRSYYSQRNFCDLLGVWVDPDTGNWYGLVHNEFTPQPFGDGLHYDSIDYAASTDQGHTWTIRGHAITSPFSTTRGDTKAFPNETYYYGDGDQRLYVDPASGYFYVYYTSRVVAKGGVSGGNDALAHVARAPIAAKMATGSWQKWYDGRWSQPGVGGKESNMVPVDSTNSTGYTPVSKDYSPANAGTVPQQIAAGTLPPKSPLVTMNITYDAYLGLYIGEPEVNDQDKGGPQQFYATDNLATQKWHLIADSGSYTSGSWYRWTVDSTSLTGGTVVGKTFRSYCVYLCHNGDGEWVDYSIAPNQPAAPAVRANTTYSIGTGSHRYLTQVGNSVTAAGPLGNWPLAQWRFRSTGDGAYAVVNALTGKALGVGGGNAGRAWGAAASVTPIASSGPTVQQQWFLIPTTDPRSGRRTGDYRLVNRSSGLVLDLSGGTSTTTPVRTWTAKAQGQVLSLRAARH